MEIRSYEFILEAQTAIAHHEGTEGNIAVAMTRKVAMPDGTFQQVPIVTGDTMRHGLREAVVYALLDAAGMLKDPALSEGALRLLFAGGMVTGKGDGAVIKLDQFRRLCELVPPLRLLGGCCDNRVIPGSLEVNDALLICEESAHMLPEWIHDWLEGRGRALASRRQHVEMVQRVRMDPTLSPHKQKLLTGSAMKQLEARTSAAETAHETGDALSVAESKSSMMPRSFETVVQGSLFYWRLDARVFSELDADTLMTMIGAFFYNAVVGGKKGTGHGRIKAIAGVPVRVMRPSDKAEVIDPKHLGEGAGNVFGEHVKAHAAEIREFMREVNA